MKIKFGVLVAIATALLAAGACSDNDTIAGPNATATPTTPPGTTATPPGPTLTATPPVLTATATPPGPTVTPTPPAGTTRIVDVGPGGSMTFVDRVTGSSTTTISVGDTVNWIWQADIHSTTSGTCAAVCTPDGIWDSGVGAGLNFSHTFTQAGTFPYYCTAHGAMMTGLVVVQ
jgi:plastocyanin